MYIAVCNKRGKYCRIQKKNVRSISIWIPRGQQIYPEHRVGLWGCDSDNKCPLNLFINFSHKNSIHYTATRTVSVSCGIWGTGGSSVGRVIDMPRRRTTRKSSKFNKRFVARPQRGWLMCIVLMLVLFPEDSSGKAASKPWAVGAVYFRIITQRNVSLSGVKSTRRTIPLCILGEEQDE